MIERNKYSSLVTIVMKGRKMEKRLEKLLIKYASILLQICILPGINMNEDIMMRTVDLPDQSPNLSARSPSNGQEVDNLDRSLVAMCYWDCARGDQRYQTYV